MNSAREVAPQIGIAAACLGLGVARATFYRAQGPAPVQQANVPRAAPPRALTDRPVAHISKLLKDKSKV